VKDKRPSYIRLGKAGEPIVHSGINNFTIGDGLCLHKGDQTAILTTGAMLKYASDFIQNNKLNFGLYSFPFIKPMDAIMLKQISQSYQKIITLEEHQRSAGFGSAVLECLHDLIEQKKINSIPYVKRIAIPDKFISVAGSQDHLRNLSGLILNTHN
jgi:transketolase